MRIRRARRTTACHVIIVTYHHIHPVIFQRVIRLARPCKPWYLSLTTARSIPTPLGSITFLTATVDNQHPPAAYEIKQLARKYNAVIGYGHDMDKFRELKKAPEYYE